MKLLVQSRLLSALLCMAITLSLTSCSGQGKRPEETEWKVRSAAVSRFESTPQVRIFISNRTGKQLFARPFSAKK